MGNDYSKYDKDKYKRVILSMMIGGCPISKICRGNRKTRQVPVDYVTILRWRREDPEFDAAYKSAQIDQVNLWAYQIVDIADTEKDPAKATVRISARKWLASRVLRETFGDRVDTNVSGKVEFGAVKVVHLPAGVSMYPVIDAQPVKQIEQQDDKVLDDGGGINVRQIVEAAVQRGRVDDDTEDDDTDGEPSE
jgi:hypothetical protein